MKSIFILSYILFISIRLSAQTPVQTHGALSVLGNQIVDKNNQAVSFAGTSFFWSNNSWGGEAFYNPQTVSWLVSDWDINIVRAAMGVEDSGGYLSDRNNNKAKVNTVVSAAINEDIYVIIDWHSHHAENYQADAIAFFQEMATLYGQYDNVIYEIYNEPLQVSWDNVIKPYATAVIAAIRAIDPNNLIVVGTPTWSQDVDIASLNPITGYSNIAYTLHFYAATHKQSLRNKAITALNNGIALMVTEWGAVSANGNGAVDQVSTNDWMTFLCNNNISHCNWSVNDKLEGASALVQGASTTGNWSMSDLTPSGQLVRNIVLNWGGSCGTTTNPTPQTAYGGTPHTVPGRVEAEHYDIGGEGIAYHDLSSGNTGNQFRTDHVDIEGTGDASGVYNIGWTEGGEWLEYTINCTTTNNYDLSMRVGSALSTGKYKVLIDGVDQTGDVVVPNTGSWQSYQTLNSSNINITAGTHVIRIEILSGGVNLNYWTISSSSSSPSPQTAYGGTPHVVPGRVEAEHYDMGGEGVAYHDLNTGNAGNQFRVDHVDIGGTGDVSGSYDIGWTEGGEWLEYTINCTATNSYNFSMRFSTPLSTGKYKVLIDGIDQTGDVVVPNTGSWQNYQMLNSSNINITAGAHIVRIEILSGGVNLNYWSIDNVPISAKKANKLTLIDYHENLNIYPNPTDQQFINVEFKNLKKQAKLQMFDLQGKMLKEQFLTKAYSKVDLTDIYHGVYLVRITEDDYTITKQIIVVE